MDKSAAKSKRHVSSAFDDIFADKEKAANYLIRSRLMLIIRRFIDVNCFTQQKAAEFFGTTQPRISDLIRGRIEKFSIDILVRMVEKAGWSVDFDVTQKKVA